MLSADERAALAALESLRLEGILDEAGLLALSDLHEANGDMAMAALCRFMPDNPRVPEFEYGAFDWWCHKDDFPKAMLPEVVWERILVSDSNGTYTSRQDADRDLGATLLGFDAAELGAAVRELAERIAELV